MQRTRSCITHSTYFPSFVEGLEGRIILLLLSAQKTQSLIMKLIIIRDLKLVQEVRNSMRFYHPNKKRIAKFSVDF